MNRRGFFGLLGGAAVAGPSVAKSAAEMGMADLRFPGITGGLSNAGGMAPGAPTSGPSDGESWASYHLKKLIGKTDLQIAKEKREMYVNMLDPDVASLRSVSLGSKIRIQKRVEYDRVHEREIENCKGILAGLWE